MNKVWMLSERKNEGVLPDIGLGTLAMEARSLLPGGVSCSHSHDLIEEICMFKAGTGRIQIGEDFFDAGAGLVAVINAGEFHEISNTGDDHLEYVSFFNTNVDLTTVRLKTRDQHSADYDMPSYAGLLGKIVVSETCKAAAFERWSKQTADVALSKTLRLVALRDAMHAGTFKKRLNELGCPVEGDVGPALEVQIQLYESDAGDLDKLKCFSANRDAYDHSFDTLFADRTIDPMTGCLLGRYLAEGRDSLRLLDECYQALIDPREVPLEPLQEAAPAMDLGVDAVGEAVTSLTGMVDALKAEIAALKASNMGQERPTKSVPLPREKRRELQLGGKAGSRRTIGGRVTLRPDREF